MVGKLLTIPSAIKLDTLLPIVCGVFIITYNAPLSLLILQEAIRPESKGRCIVYNGLVCVEGYLNLDACASTYQTEQRQQYDRTEWSNR